MAVLDVLRLAAYWRGCSSLRLLAGASEHNMSTRPGSDASHLCALRSMHPAACNWLFVGFVCCDRVDNCFLLDVICKGTRLHLMLRLPRHEQRVVKLIRHHPRYQETPLRVCCKCTAPSWRPGKSLAVTGHLPAAGLEQSEASAFASSRCRHETLPRQNVPSGCTEAHCRPGMLCTATQPNKQGTQNHPYMAESAALEDCVESGMLEPARKRRRHSATAFAVAPARHVQAALVDLSCNFASCRD